MNEHINFYDLLGVSKNASSEEIKKAYRKQMMAWHPDKNKSDNASEIASKLNEAKEILLDETKRKQYDEELENTKKKVYEHVSNANKKGSKTNKKNNSNSEEKYYTKWEYFLLYLRHYNVPIWRKILAIVFVVLETLFCFIFEVINVIISYFIYYSYDILYSIGIIASIYLMIMGCVPLIMNIDFDMMKTLLYIFGGLIVLFIVILLPKIYEITVIKIPVYISKINLFLFKKSIGYK